MAYDKVQVATMRELAAYDETNKSLEKDLKNKE